MLGPSELGICRRDGEVPNAGFLPLKKEIALPAGG